MAACLNCIFSSRLGNVHPYRLQVYGYQSLKAGSQSEQLIGRFAKRSTNLPIDGPRAVVASKVRFMGSSMRLLATMLQQGDCCDANYHVMIAALSALGLDFLYFHLRACSNV